MVESPYLKNLASLKVIKMGSDDIFKRKRKSREERKHSFRNPRANSFLIVTEGERTEPLYFAGIRDIIKGKTGGIIDIFEMSIVDIQGEGHATMSLIKRADFLVKKSKVNYQNVWVVFDKDDFADFDDAIKIAEKRGYKVAWSNPSFEYWLFLHFHFSDSALHRDEWESKLSELFKRKACIRYQKNEPDMFNIVGGCDGARTAIANCQKRMNKYVESEQSPSQFIPGSVVFKLVEELLKFT